MTKEKIQIVVDVEIHYETKKGRKEVVRQSLEMVRDFDFATIDPQCGFRKTKGKKAKLIEKL